MVYVSVEPPASHICLPQTHCQLFKATYTNNHVHVDHPLFLTHTHTHTYTHPLDSTGPLPPAEGCGQISLFSLSSGSFHWALWNVLLWHPRLRSLLMVSSVHHSIPPPPPDPLQGFLLRASNHQELIRKWVLSTCHEWIFKHNNTDTWAKAVVSICQDKRSASDFFGALKKNKLTDLIACAPRHPCPGTFKSKAAHKGWDCWHRSAHLTICMLVLPT